MRAGIFRSKGQPLVIENIPIPQPGPGQVLVEVKACGICGSDIHAVKADWTPENIVMGHEFSGVVAAVGKGVERCRKGDRVIPLPQVSCGQCPACITGNTFECEKWGRIDPNPMITHTIKLDELPAMIETLQNPSDQIKVIVNYAS